jgi:hypothetical protein
MRSSTSTVSGKKSKWSFGCFDAVVAESSMVSSSRYATTAPAACLARRPVSKRTVRVPNRPLSMTASVSCTVTPVESVIDASPLWFLRTTRVSHPGTRFAGDARGMRPVFDRSPRDSSRKPLPRTGGRTLVRARAVLLLKLLQRGGATRWSLPLGCSYRRRPRRWISAR